MVRVVEDSGPGVDTCHPHFGACPLLLVPVLSGERDSRSPILSGPDKKGLVDIQVSGPKTVCPTSHKQTPDTICRLIDMLQRRIMVAFQPVYPVP